MMVFDTQGDDGSFSHISWFSGSFEEVGGPSWIIL